MLVFSVVVLWLLLLLLLLPFAKTVKFRFYSKRFGDYSWYNEHVAKKNTNFPSWTFKATKNAIKCMQSKAIYQEKSVTHICTLYICGKRVIFVIFIVNEQSTVVQTTNLFGQTNFFSYVHHEIIKWVGLKWVYQLYQPMDNLMKKMWLLEFDEFCLNCFFFWKFNSETVYISASLTYKNMYFQIPDTQQFICNQTGANFTVSISPKLNNLNKTFFVCLISAYVWMTTGI